MFTRLIYLTGHPLEHSNPYPIIETLIRGGVEDTRLEAKDTKKSEAKDKDTGASFSKKKCLQKNLSGNAPSPKKSSSKFFFRRSPKEEKKKGLRKFSAGFLAFSIKILTIQKTVLSSSRGQGNFREFKDSRPRTSKCVLEAKDVLEDSTSDVYGAKSFSSL